MIDCTATRQHGFTLIEMLTVVAIFGLVAIYVGRILIVNERAYHTVEQTSESQQNLRVFGEFVEDDIRHAGMMTPRDAAVCGRDFTDAPDILYVSDSAAIAVQDEEWDAFDGPIATGAAITAGPSAAVPFGGAVTLTLGSLIVEPSAPSRPAYDTDSNGVADSDFRRFGGVIVYDITDAARGNACGRITAVNIASKEITVTGVAALGAAGGGPELRAVPANEYFLNGTQLRWNGVALADGIEDFQVAYIFDQNGDNVIDPADDRRSFGDAGGTDYTSSELPPNEMRELAIGLVSRARLSDAAFAGRPQALLNRAAIVTPDGFRRRAFESRVLLRNLGLRKSS